VTHEPAATNARTRARGRRQPLGFRGLRGPAVRGFSPATGSRAPRISVSSDSRRAMRSADTPASASAVVLASISSSRARSRSTCRSRFRTVRVRASTRAPTSPGSAARVTPATFTIPWSSTSVTCPPGRASGRSRRGTGRYRRAPNSRGALDRPEDRVPRVGHGPCRPANRPRPRGVTSSRPPSPARGSRARSGPDLNRVRGPWAR
jgi:hypothetical protein